MNAPILLLLLIIIRDASGRSVATYVKERTLSWVSATVTHGNFLHFLPPNVLDLM